MSERNLIKEAATDADCDLAASMADYIIEYMTTQKTGYTAAFIAMADVVARTCACAPLGQAVKTSAESVSRKLLQDFLQTCKEMFEIAMEDIEGEVTVNSHSN